MHVPRSNVIYDITFTSRALSSCVWL